MPTKPVLSISYDDALSLGTVIELVGLATGGKVLDRKVSSIAASYTFDQNHGRNVQVKNTRERSAAEFKCEVESVQRVLRMQSKAIEECTNLAFEDLEQIWLALAGTKLPVKKLMQDSAFHAIFPYAELVDGTYEELRHKSGCAILLVTRQDGILISHRIDAPVSGREKVSDEHSYGVYDPNGYLGSDTSRWHISKLLGAVPEQHKSKVFAWAAEAIFTVKEYHNTRGGIRLPERFVYHCEGVHLEADRELRFERKV